MIFCVLFVVFVYLMIGGYVAYKMDCKDPVDRALMAAGWPIVAAWWLLRPLGRFLIFITYWPEYFQSGRGRDFLCYLKNQDPPEQS